MYFEGSFLRLYVLVAFALLVILIYRASGLSKGNKPIPLSPKDFLNHTRREAESNKSKLINLTTVVEDVIHFNLFNN